jgi:NSS family neurotransmitter:Na+ symporter
MGGGAITAADLRRQYGGVGALKEAVGPAWGLVGAWGVLAGFTILSYYAVVGGWSLYYFSRTVGWSLTGFPSALRALDVFNGVVADGGMQLLLSGVFMALTVGVVYFGVQRGIERVARTFLPVLFGILVLLLVSALTMEGAGEAVTFIFRPSFDEIGLEGAPEDLGHS